MSTWGQWLGRRGAPPETGLMFALSLLTLGVVWSVWTDPDLVPISCLMVPLLVGSLLLPPRLLPWFVLWVVVALGLCALAQPTLSARTWGAIGIQLLMCAIVLGSSLRRGRLGVAGATGESMFVDLRDRILAQGGIPVLPEGWHVDTALRSAGGTPFAGDFLVATRPDEGRFELALVDVSGKGEDAGTRALLLSGALGGLLGALPAEQFLPAANDYLLRQDWEEGFATAVHLSLDLAGGRYEVRSAGHPPAALRSGVRGRWALLPSSGPVLGLMADAEFEVAAGHLHPDDAVLLYTDGMVETAGRDLDHGIARLLAAAEEHVHGSPLLADAAADLVDALGSRDDDRALVVVSRS
jgi:hypothetical protein